MLRYAITDRARYPGDEAAREEALLQQAARLAEEGVDYVQLREKDLAPAALAALTRRILTSLRANAHAREGSSTRAQTWPSPPLRTASTSLPPKDR